jgi:hypothetical protein
MQMEDSAPARGPSSFRHMNDMRPFGQCFVDITHDDFPVFVIFLVVAPI